MNRPRDDEYDSLRDLLGGGSDEDPSDSRREPADSDDLGDLPPGVPPEYADVYRSAYERALRGEEPTVGIEKDAPAPAPPADRAPEPSTPSPSAPAPPAVEPVGEEPTRQIPVGGSSAPEPSPGPGATRAPKASGPQPARPPRSSYGGPGDSDEARRRKRLAAIGLGVLAVLLVLGAFGIGRLFADNAASSETSTGSESAGSGGSESEGNGEAQQPAPYQGAVSAVPVADAAATCQSGSSIDAAGNPTTYEPAKAYDKDFSTAWRCDGSGAGQKFTLTLPEETTVAEVGLVPGYAKTDPASGVDRYAENNRITKVRWRFDDGSTYVQKMKGDPADRSMRTRRLPETTTSQVVIEILASQPGTRNTVAISEIRIATPSG